MANKVKKLTVSGYSKVLHDLMLAGTPLAEEDTDQIPAFCVDLSTALIRAEHVSKNMPITHYPPHFTAWCNAKKHLAERVWASLPESDQKSKLGGWPICNQSLAYFLYNDEDPMPWPQLSAALAAKDAGEAIDEAKEAPKTQDPEAIPEPLPYIPDAPVALSNKFFDPYPLKPRPAQRHLMLWLQRMFTAARTQKARGVFSLLRYNPNLEPDRYGLGGPRMPYAFLPHDISNEYDADDRSKFFARPCPVTPRHGFVESRAVSGLSEAYELLGKARKEDPLAEVLVMPVLSGLFSGIANNAGVWWANGNDGVTSATSMSLLIPTAVDANSWRNKCEMFSMVHTSMSELGCSAAAVPYIEIVEDYSLARLVQLRPGPPATTQPNFIPKVLEVLSVLSLFDWIDKNTAPDDNSTNTAPEVLLLWEKVVQELSPRTVIWAPECALSSHYAVHAIVKGIPFVTSCPRPEVGQTLLPPKNVHKPLDLTAIGQLVQKMFQFDSLPLFAVRPPSATFAFAANMQCIRMAGMVAVGTVHCAPRWDDAEHLLTLRAYGYLALARLLTMVCLGELRHWFVHGPGRDDGLPCPINFTDLGFDIRKKASETPARERVFFAGAEVSFAELYRVFPLIRDGFAMTGWSRDEGGSPYGGARWAQSSWIVWAYMNSLKTFMSEPSKDSFANMQMAANRALNAAHNGGLLLDKIISAEALELSNGPAFYFMNSLAGALVLHGTGFIPYLRGHNQ